MSAAPVLSVVVTSRNDDHGGGMLRRFGLFADGLVEQARRHGLPGELVVVEWNPPSGPRLYEALHLRAKWDGFRIRFVEVPPELHARIPHAEAFPLFQMIAKNVGIRRAHGRFVLATNPDVLMNDVLFRALASPDLDPGALYRVDRTDVAADVPLDSSLDDQLAWCDAHVLRVHTRWGSIELPEPGPQRGRAGLAYAFARHQLADRSRRGWLRSGVRLASTGLATGGAWLRSQVSPRVHTNGCGDFTLLSREAWHRLRGYAEFGLWSMHLDALLCFTVVAAGHEQRVLPPPARLYHVEHGGSWAALSVAERLRLFERRPWLDPTVVESAFEEMRFADAPTVFNGPGWGFGDEDLPEEEA